jgi:predicted TIM-barrel fold metal-dependent hydrolase
VGVLPDVDETLVAELERMRNELHLKGVLISSNIDGQPLDAAKMWLLYERAAALDFPIWIHPANARYYPWLNPRERMFMILGWPFETTLAMASLVFGGVFKRYPTLKVIVHHAGGGMVPFYYERIKSYLDSDSASIALPENEQRVDPGDFTRFYVDTVVNGSQAALQCSLALFGADHMLFGTDFPFGPKGGETWLPRVLQSVQELDVSQRDREKIFSGNASLLLHL